MEKLHSELRIYGPMEDFEADPSDAESTVKHSGLAPAVLQTTVKHSGLALAVLQT